MFQYVLTFHQVAVYIFSMYVSREYSQIREENGVKRRQTLKIRNYKTMLGADPPENCHLNVQKIAQNLTFFSKELTKLSFFLNCH